MLQAVKGYGADKEQRQRQRIGRSGNAAIDDLSPGLLGTYDSEDKLKMISRRLQKAKSLE